MTTQASRYNVTYTYGYDDNGNITSISDGTNTTTYAYDTAGQLLRENNQAANTTWTWTYDNTGNILTRSQYAYTTGEQGTPTGSRGFESADKCLVCQAGDYPGRRMCRWTGHEAYSW